MERHTYNTSALMQALEHFERDYSMSSQQFYERYRRDDPTLTVPGFKRHLWASFYQEVLDEDDGTFAASVEGTLQLA